MKDKNINWTTLPNLASLGWTVKLHEDIRYLTIASVLSCTNCKSLLSNSHAQKEELIKGTHLLLEHCPNFEL